MRNGITSTARKDCISRFCDPRQYSNVNIHSNRGSRSGSTVTIIVFTQCRIYGERRGARWMIIPATSAVMVGDDITYHSMNSTAPTMMHTVRALLCFFMVNYRPNCFNLKVNCSDTFSAHPVILWEMLYGSTISCKNYGISCSTTAKEMELV